MTSLDDLYNEANVAKQKGEIDKAIQLYQSVIDQYPNTMESNYAEINIKEIDGTAQNYYPNKSRVLLSTVTYGLIGAFIGFILPFSLLPFINRYSEEGIIIPLLIVYTLPFGLLVGAIIGFGKGMNPKKNDKQPKI